MMKQAAMDNSKLIAPQRVRFEEVTPANEYAAFFDASIDSLVAHLKLPIYEGYDDIDDLRFAFLTLPSGETVTIGAYLNTPEQGTFLYIDSRMKNVSQIVFESCRQLQLSKQEVEWFHPDYEEEIDRLYAEFGDIPDRLFSSQVKDVPHQDRSEQIDIFHHALQIYTRQKSPEYWAMLQHNLGLAYYHRTEGNRRDNLERSIECYHNAMQVHTQAEFPAKWENDLQDLEEAQVSLDLLPYIESSFLSSETPDYITLKLNGKGSKFLENFLASTDITTQKINLDSIRKHENPTFKAGFIILFNALRIRQWIVQDNKGNFQISDQYYQDFYMWISNAINDEIEYEETLKNTTAFSQLIGEIRIEMPVTNLNMKIDW
jgi:hypothetical protein